jgi:hypothetical protein
MVVEPTARRFPKRAKRGGILCQTIGRADRESVNVRLRFLQRGEGAADGGGIMERVGWHGEISGEDTQGGGAVDRDAGLVDPAGVVVDGGKIEAELRGEEAIHGVAF